MRKKCITTKKDTRYENVDAHKHATKKQKQSDGCLLGCLLELPIPLIYDILSRLPMKTLFSCICVCKTFPKFHTDPYFAQVHLIKAPNDDRCLIIQNRLKANNMFFINMIDFGRLYPPPPWNDDQHVWDSHLWKTLTLPTNISKPKFDFIPTLVGSCNGLVCLNYHVEPQRNMLCVCNPILGEFMVLPQPWPYILYLAFGYCPKSKQYKVLRFTSLSICEIHTLGTDYWKKICNVPYPSTLNGIDSSSLDGNIPWVTETSKVSEMICSFNLEMEQYLYISPPAHFYTNNNHERMSFIKVGSVGGLFCISYILDNFQFEVYVMKNYGVESSWTKYITFYMGMKYRLLSMKKSRLYLRLTYDGLLAIMLLNNRDLLFSYRNGALVYYRPQKAGVINIIEVTAERELEDMALGVYDAVEFFPSFMSLKNIGKDGSVTVVQRESCRAFGLTK